RLSRSGSQSSSFVPKATPYSITSANNCIRNAGCVHIHLTFFLIVRASFTLTGGGPGAPPSLRVLCARACPERSRRGGNQTDRTTGLASYAACAHSHTFPT